MMQEFGQLVQSRSGLRRLDTSAAARDAVDAQQSAHLLLVAF